MLKRLSLSSFEFISSQYDHEVQGSSILKPLQGRGRINADATISRPLLNSQRGLVLSQGILPYYSDLDTYQMAACSLDTAVRGAITLGANLKSLALLDNFCWCSSTEPQRLGELKAAVKACYDCALIYETPFISGKDSMFNDFRGFDEKGTPIKISIPPTLLISSIGIVDDLTKTVSLDGKFPGDLLYLLGETHEELGASEYFTMLGISRSGMVPKVKAQKNKKLYQAFSKGLKEKLISSAVSVSRGGLALALAKTTMGGLLGAKLSLKKIPGKVDRDDFALFSESQGRIVVTVNPKNKRIFEKTIKGNSYALIGKIIDSKTFVIKGLKNNPIVKTDVKSMLRSYRSTFKDF